MTILYFNLTKHIPARDDAYLKGFREMGVKIIDMRDSSPGIKKFIALYKRHRALKDDYDLMWVGYAGHILVPFAALISGKPVIFNSFLSMYDGIIISRKQASVYSLKALYVWFIDFLGYNMADMSLLENNAQVDYISKTFLVPRKKLMRVWTGVNDEDFFYDPSIQKLSKFTVVFRGGLLPDSGIEYFVQAAKILKDEDIYFRLLGRGLLEDRVQKILDSFDSRKFEWTKEFLEISDLRRKMQECHISAGWFSDEPRAGRTICHKGFESMAMKLPYIHARTPAMLELLKEGETGFYCRPNDAEDLANKIMELKKNPELLIRVADNAYRLFQNEMTSRKLAEFILKELKIKNVLRA